MSSPRITFQYSGDVGNGNDPRLLLEQAPVSTKDLALDDLANMLALVRSGISAYTYITQSCAATLINGQVVVPLTLYVWPSLPDLEYELSAAIPAWTAIGPAVAVEQERDFDLVIELSDSVDLPCLAAGLEITWQTPAISGRGGVVDPPPLISGYDTALQAVGPIGSASGPINRLRLDRQVFGVLRVRCRALGYRHAITMTIPKTGDLKITNIRETVTAAWPLADGTIETETLDITLPACVETLLETCETGLYPGARSEIIDQEEMVPELHYSTCDGSLIGVVRLVRLKEETEA